VWAGTLLDSEPLSLRAWNDVLSEYGVPTLPAAYFEQYVGVSALNTCKGILNDKARPELVADGTVQNITDQKRARLTALMLAMTPEQNNELWFPGVRERLHTLVASNQNPERGDNQNIHLALCTSAKAETAAAMLDCDPIAQVLKLRVTQDNVTPDEMKPNPAPYLQAAQLLAIKPEYCIAVEDSSSGVRSAAGAGYGHVLGVLNAVAEPILTRARLQEAGATAVFDTTAAALDWVAGLVE